jgi:predicted methyltransferase
MMHIKQPLRRFSSWGPLALLAAMATATGAFAAGPTDRFDSALAHVGRSPADMKRDVADHSAEILRLTGVKPGMKVADILGGDGYYSELLSYVVGPKGHVDLINNASFDEWSGTQLTLRLANGRLPNVEHRTVDLNRIDLKAGSLDAVVLSKVYHDLYWVDAEGIWPKVDTASVLNQIARAVKRGGVLLLVDHSAQAGHGSTDASSLHRIEEEFAIKDFESRGFKVIAKSDLLRRPEDPRDKISYKPPMLGKTDRFVLVFKKVAR